MFSFLKTHPFAVEAFFECSHVFTSGVPNDEIQHLLPECLVLVTFKDKFSFIAVVMF